MISRNITITSSKTKKIREIDVYHVRIEFLHGTYSVRILFSYGLVIKRSVRTEILTNFLISKNNEKTFSHIFFFK